MPVITNISAQKNNKNRMNIFVDGEFFCAMSVEIIIKNRIKVGIEIDKEKLEKFIFENEKHDALVKATDYISKNLKTKKQVKEYLIKKGYSYEIALYCVDKLKEYDYINDEEYSKRYIESVASKQGYRLTQYKLMMKGVRKEDIDNAYLQTSIDQKENAKLIAKKYLKNKEITKENIAKAYRYLIGKGFSYDEANYAIEEYREN